MKKTLLILTLSLLIFSGLALADTDADEKMVRDIAYQLRCPVCQGLSVKESEAGIAVNMKNKIRELVKEGKSEEEIYQYFEMRYGEWIRRVPKKEGFNLFVWITPFVVIIVGLFVVINISRKKSRQVIITEEAPLTQAEQKAIDSKLKHFEKD